MHRTELHSPVGRHFDRRTLLRMAAAGSVGGSAALTGAATYRSVAAQTPAPKSGGTLRIGLNTDPDTLDPHLSGTLSAWFVWDQVYSALLSYTPDYEIIPDLATAWEQVDENTYTFTLREGVTWHDGSPFTSDDVKASVERIADPATGSASQASWTAVESMDTSQPNTITFTLSAPYAPFLHNLTGLAILPQGADAEALRTSPMGTGPFKFVEWIPGRSVTLERNDAYYIEGQPYLDRLDFRITPDNTARTTGLRTGDIDWIEYVPFKDVDLLSQGGELEVVGGPSSWYDYFRINAYEREELQDLRVRQAMAWAMDRDQYVAISLFGHGTPMHSGPIPPWSWAYTGEAVYPQQDYEKATALLTEAGYADGFAVKMIAPTNYEEMVSNAQIFAEQMKPLNIEVTVESLEWSTFLESTDYDIMSIAWSSFVDPDQYTYLTFHSGEPWEQTGVTDPELDALMEEGRATTDEEQRKDIYAQIDKMIAELAPYLFIAFHDAYEAHQPYVMGYEHYASGIRRMEHLWLDQ
jgi:peptide/nickel transport system substrate-binding protein